MEEDTGEVVEIRKAGRPVGSFKKTRDKSSFLKESHELDSAIKKTTREIAEMVDVLVNIAKDDKADTKERRMAATSVLEMNLRMIESRNKDEITRKISEVRVRGVNGGNGSVEDDDNTPILDFDNIPDEFKDNEDVQEENS